MRNIIIALGEYYHIFNRGVDKRDIFGDIHDLERFMQSIREFNTVTPIGSIYENKFQKPQLGDSVSKLQPLVEFISYCILPNHYHFILKQIHEKGIEKFIHRFALGYSMYFNKKYKRSGVLFQGAYKALHIDTNEYLLHASAYVTFNDIVHKKWSSNSLFIRSSWPEYVEKKIDAITKNGIILEQFNSVSEYKEFALDVVNNVRDQRKLDNIYSLDSNLETESPS